LDQNINFAISTFFVAFEIIFQQNYVLNFCTVYK